jgi:hypothetical protein
LDCTWQWDDGRVCGLPADAMRARFYDDHTERHYYCRIHILTVRRLTSDEDARLYWGLETWPVIRDRAAARVSLVR